MTDKANPDEPSGTSELARFLRDWTELWQGELRARSGEPEFPAALLKLLPKAADPDALRAGLLAMTSNALTSKATTSNALTSKVGASPEIDAWRSAMATWAGAMGMPAASFGDPAHAPRTQAAAAAPVPRDAAVDRLVRRIDELEARVAKLETPRRRRS